MVIIRLKRRDEGGRGRLKSRRNVEVVRKWTWKEAETLTCCVQIWKINKKKKLSPKVPSLLGSPLGRSSGGGALGVTVDLEGRNLAGRLSNALGWRQNNRRFLTIKGAKLLTVFTYRRIGGVNEPE